MTTQQDAHFMRLALAEAANALAFNEVPVGAVLLTNGEVIAQGYNRVITDSDPSAHAEIMALRAAGKAQSNYRLPATTLYVTLEPCPMCIAALFHARVERVVFGASDAKTGACGGHVDLSALAINHHTRIEGGVLAAECAAPLQAFFKARREAVKLAKLLV